MKEYTKPEVQYVLLTVEDALTDGSVGGSTGVIPSPFGLDVELEGL